MSETSSRDREEFGLDSSEVRHEPAAGRGRLRLYAAVLCVAPFLAIAGSILWLSSAAYARHVQLVGIQSVGYSMRLEHADCDVVIDGDSSAEVGLDPDQVREVTGLTACNIAENAGVRKRNGNLVLDHYLQHNRRPKYLVFQFVPEDMVPPEAWGKVSLFEGMYLRFQYMPQPDAGFYSNYLLKDPEQTLLDLELGLRMGVRWLRAKPMPPELAEERELHHGLLRQSGQPMTECFGVMMRPPDKNWVQQLRTKYGVDGTRVLVDATMEPACAPDHSYYVDHLRGVTDNALGALPLSDYNAEGHLHANAGGRREMTAALAEQILHLEQGGR